MKLTKKQVIDCIKCEFGYKTNQIKDTYKKYNEINKLINDLLENKIKDIDFLEKIDKIIKDFAFYYGVKNSSDVRYYSLVRDGIGDILLELLKALERIEYSSLIKENNKTYANNLILIIKKMLFKDENNYYWEEFWELSSMFDYLILECDIEVVKDYIKE